YRAVRHTIEARQQRADRRLARTGRTNEGNRFARANGNVETIDDGAVRAIAETHIAIFDIAGQAGNCLRTGAVRNVRARVEKLRVTLETGDPLRIGFDDRIDLFDRT